MPPSADKPEPETSKVDLLSSSSRQLEQAAWNAGKQSPDRQIKKERGVGLSAYGKKAAGDSGDYNKLMSILYQDYGQRFPRFANVEPLPEDQVKQAKVKPAEQRDAQLAKMQSELEAKLAGRAAIYAQAAGVFDSAANAHDFEAMEAVLTALPTMAADKDVASLVVDTVKKVDSENGTVGIASGLDYLRRMTVHYSGISQEQPNLANELRHRIAPAEGYAMSRLVLSEKAGVAGSLFSGGKLSPKDWGEILNPVLGPQSPVTAFIEREYQSVDGRPNEPAFVANALSMALGNPELVQQIGPQETDRLKMMILGCTEYVLDNLGEGNVLDRRVAKAASLVYEVCGEQTLAEATSGNGVLAEKLSKVANRAGDALKVVDPKITSSSGTEALSQKFADKETAKTEIARAAARAEAEERRRQEEAVAAAAQRKEEERIKAAIEEAANALRAALNPADMWRMDKSLLGRPKGTYSPTPAWKEQFGNTSKQIKELRALSELNPSQRIQLAALQRHSKWLSEGSKPAASRP